MAGFNCPICGAANGTCTDGQPYRMPADMEDLDPMANSRAIESAKVRMPKQFVREGRGTSGYKGNVEVYDPRGAEPEPERTQRIVGGKKSRSPQEDK